jgi:hypothetical protein
MGLAAFTMCLEGPLANLPSSNGKQIRRHGNRISTGNNARQIAYLEALTALYIRELCDMGKPLSHHRPAFGKQKTFCLIINTSQGRRSRWDASNIPKLFCDWCEQVGIIDDDQHLEALSLKAKDMGVDDGKTWIYFGPFEVVKKHSQEMGREFRQLSGVPIEAV